MDKARRVGMDRARIAKLCEEAKKAGLDGMLVCPSAELRFLLGFTPMMCERFQGLFVSSEGTCFYVCNLLYTGEIEHEVNGAFPVYSWRDGESMTDCVKQALGENGLLDARLGVNTSAPAFNTLDIAEECGVTFVNALRTVEEARIIKTSSEIEDLRKAASIADAAFADVLGFIKPGLREGEIRDFMSEKMIAAGGSAPWGIIASGPNSSYPHYTGSDRIVGDRDVIILDFGCTYGGMCSDMTRTVFIGEPTEEQKKVYDIVLRANEAGETAAVNGAYVPEVDAAARDIIAGEGYGEYFITRLGHGIGYMIHEAPDIKKNNLRNLEPGMAFSIEPGIYLTGNFGVRIEDIVVVNESGNEILNKSPKKMIVL